MARVLVICLSLFAFAVGGHATDLYVKSKRARVVRSPRRRRSVKRVERGDKLKKLKYRRRWYKVRVGRKRGWIYRGRVTRRKPKRDKSLEIGGRYNPLAAESMAAGSGLRGLGDLSLKYSDRNPVTDKHKQYMDYHQSFITSDSFKPKLTERGIEPVKIGSEEIEKFMEEGNLGPYAQVEGEFDEE